jgi:hypothetical protein
MAEHGLGILGEDWPNAFADERKWQRGATTKSL